MEDKKINAAVKKKVFEELSYALQYGPEVPELNNRIGEILLTANPTCQNLRRIVWSCRDQDIRSRAWQKLLAHPQLNEKELIHIISVQDEFNEFEKIWEPLCSRKPDKDTLIKVIVQGCSKAVKQKAAQKLITEFELDYFDLRELVSSQIDTDSDMIDLFGKRIIQTGPGEMTCPENRQLIDIIIYCTDAELYKTCWHHLLHTNGVEEYELARIITTCTIAERQLDAWQQLKNMRPLSAHLIDIMTNSPGNTIQGIVLDYVLQ